MERASPRLADRTIALLEARRSDELAALIEKQGGRVYRAPALREEDTDAPAAIVDFLDRLRTDPPDYVILQTGVGTTRLLAAAEAAGRREEWRRHLARAVVVVRGPKPVAALRAAGLTAHVLAAAPYTSAEVLAALEPHDLRDRHVAVQHHGERNAELVAALLRRGARVSEVAVYRWALPEDTAPLRRLLRAIPSGAIAAIAFTSQAQVQHLCHIAEVEGLRDALPELLRRHTVVAAVGPVTARALGEQGIAVDVVADPPKAGALIAALATHLQHRSGRPSLTRGTSLGIYDQLDRTSRESAPPAVGASRPVAAVGRAGR